MKWACQIKVRGPRAKSTKVMTISDLAKYFQLSKSSLYKLAQEGRVPAQKVGMHWRFHKVVIDKWLASGANMVSRN